MNKQKLDANCVLKQNKVLRNNKGFSLIEIMIASAISMVVSLGIASIFVYTVQQFSILVEMNNAQENLLWASYHTKNLMSQAVELDSSDPNLDGIIDDAYNKTSVAAATPPANRQVMAARFLREWGLTSSDLVQTQVTLQRPSADRGDGGQGFVFFDVNTPNGTAMSPGLDDIFYDKIVEYDITNVRSDIDNQTTGATISITTRHHKSTDRTSWNWCRAVDISANTNGCGMQDSDAAYVDSNMSFSVSFRNNNALKCVDSSGLSVDCSNVNAKPLSLHGGIYYFKFIPPRVNF